MNPFGPRSGIQELAALLDGSLPAGAGNQAAAQLHLAQRLRTTGTALAPTVAPRAEFRAALRTRLMAVAAVRPIDVPMASVRETSAQETSARTPASPSWRRAGVVAAGAIASVVAVSGVAVAGSQSLPGDPFYGVKRGTEALQLRTADGDLDKGTLHLDFASTRLQEVRGLTFGRDAAERSATLPAGAALAAPVAEKVRQTLADMDDNTRLGRALLTDAFETTRAAEPLLALSRFATQQTVALEQLLPSLPPSSQEQARSSLALISAVVDDTDEMLGLSACGPTCDPSSLAPGMPGLTWPPVEPLTPVQSAPPCGCESVPTPSAQPIDGEPTGGSSATGEPGTEPGPSPQPTDGSSAAPEPTAGPTTSPTRAPVLPLPTLLPGVPQADLPLTELPIAPLLDSLFSSGGPLSPLPDPLGPSR